jgi:hypothetical protein
MAAESRFNRSTLSPAFLMFFPVRDAFLAWLPDLSELLWGLDFGVFFTLIPPICSVDMLALVYFCFMEITTARRPPRYYRRYPSMKFEKPLEGHR